VINNIRLKPEVVLIVTKASTKVFHLQYRGRILGRNWDKNLKTFSSKLYTVTSTNGFYSPPLVFLELRFRKEENLIENFTPLPPYGFRIHTKKINQSRKLKFVHEIAFCRKQKPKVPTSSLRNLKIMPRNFNKIVLS
jgi:hypothetical protein